MCTNVLKKLGLTYSTPLAMLTIGQLLDVIQKVDRTEPQGERKYLRGLKAIGDHFGGVSKKTVCQWCKGWLAPAIEKRGNTVICDQEMADELFAGRK